jgi:hypothetical protein
MMEQEERYSRASVDAVEKLARIALSPKDIDPETNYPKDSFITLRSAEEGVSFLRFDYMGEESFRKSGEERAALYNKNQKRPKYAFVGWMEAIAEEIVSLSPDVIILKVNDPENRPEHVNICFRKEGEIVKGIVTDAEILDIMDEIFHTLRYVMV